MNVPVSPASRSVRLSWPVSQSLAIPPRCSIAAWRMTRVPDDEVPTHRLGSNDGLRPKRADSVPSIPAPGAPAHYAPTRADANAPARFDSRARELPLPPRAETPVPVLARGSEPVAPRTLTGRPPSRPMTRSSIPELPGFGEYLVETGILTRERLRAAQAYQRSMKVQLSTAIVTLGLATPQRIEWAAVAHQSQLAHR